MRPTRVPTLVAWCIAATALVWGALRLAENRGDVLPMISSTAPVAMYAVAGAVVAATVGLRSRLRRGERQVHPLSMARFAVLGKASAHVGALMAGGYLGYVLLLLPSLDIDARRDRAVLATLVMVAAVVLVVAGLVLESLCRIRRDPEETLRDAELSDPDSR